MKMYSVSLWISEYVTLEAESSEDAKEKVVEMIANDPEGYADMIQINSAIEEDTPHE